MRLLLCASFLLAAAPSLAQSLVVDGANSPFRIDADTTYDDVSVNSGGTLLVHAELTVVGDMTVNNGGIVSHDAATAGLAILDVGGTLDVRPGGSIDVSARGLGAALRWDDISQSVVPGAGSRQGGSHGGRGGYGGPDPHGNARGPLTYGGGGGYSNCTSVPGAGGGRVVLRGGTLRVDGLVRANGGNGSGNCDAGGGGAGGSIFIETATLSGAGTITANGGNGIAGGGGGRIAAFVTTFTFSGGIATAGGTGGYGSGVTGTSYLLVGGTTLRVAGGNAQIGAGDVYTTVSMLPGGTLTLTGAASVTNLVALPASTTLIVNDASAFSALDIPGRFAADVIVNVPLAWPQGMIIDGDLVANAEIQVPGDITVESTGIVTHDVSERDFALNATGTIHVKLGAIVDANGRGLPAATGIDPLTLLEVNNVGSYGGGSYGGRGGGNSNPSYGDPRDPQFPGAGGGYTNCTSVPGRGGGVLRLIATTVRVDGTVRANGGGGSGNCDAGSGGSGGTVRIESMSFLGAGVVSASGGSGGGGGGGGRILVQYTTNTFTGSINVLGAGSGAAGSVFVESAANDLVVGAGVTTIGAGDVFNSVTLQQSAQLRIVGNATIDTVLNLPAGATVILESPDALDNIAMPTRFEGTLIVNTPFTWSQNMEVKGTLYVNEPLDVIGNMTVELGGLVTHNTGDSNADLFVTGTLDVRAASSIDASARGLGPATGYDPLTLQPVSNVGSYGGGSYGGRGSGNSNPTYGDARDPQFLGSGGGYSNCTSVPGRGGGRVSIEAATIKIDGTLRADGQSGSGNCDPGAGGSGGSIKLVSTTFTGNGLVTSNGGNGAGGGGGGRVAVTYDTTTFSGSLSANGGSPSGSAGTVFVESSSSDLVVPSGLTAIDGGDVFTSVTLQPGAILDVRGPARIDSILSVSPGATLLISSTDALDQITLDPIIDGTLKVNVPIAFPDDLIIDGTLVVNQLAQVSNLTVNLGGTVTHDALDPDFDLRVAGTLQVSAGAFIDVTGKGYLGGPQSGFGAQGATLDGSTLLAGPGSGNRNGGSHGTLGGVGNAGAPLAPIYDAPANPIRFGGGGGNNNCTSYGGNGGGLVKITAGILTIDGSVTSNGTGGTGNCDAGAGGAGGSINLVAGEWRGAGTINARGGNGGGNTGGGAGGLVRVSFGIKTFTGPITVVGGTATVTGAAGIVTEEAVTAAPEIISTAPDSASVGRLFRYQPLATGSVPMTWTLPEAPAGASIDFNSGEIIWLPSDTLPASFRVRAQNALGNDEQSFLVQPTSAPFISSTPTVLAVAGQAYHYDADDTASAVGTTPLTWTASVGATGFTINASTGFIAWTPQSAGTVPLCIVATNTFGQQQQCFTVIVTAPDGSNPAVITSSPALSGFVGVTYAYDSDGTAEAEGDQPITWATLLAPAGLGIDPQTGAVSWTPDAAGDFGVCIVASNVAGEDTQCFTVTIELAGPPVFVSRPITLATQGVPYPYDLDGAVAVSGSGPITFSSPTGPPELSIDADTGVVTWTPAAAGQIDVVLRAENPYGATDQAFNVSVLPTGASSPPVIVQSANLLAAVDTPYIFDADGVVDVGGDPPIVITATTAPDGFTVDPETGLITWVPAQVGSYDVSLRAENAFGADVYDFTVEVIAEAGLPPTAVAHIDPIEGDAPLTVTADGSESFAPPGKQIVFARWSFGDDTAPVSEVLSEHVYERAGSYVARLRVADAVGAAGETSVVVIVRDAGVRPPQARILVPNLDGSDELTVSFSCDCAAGDAPIEAYLWDFGDGTQSDLPAVTHVFGPGGFEVRLTIVDGNGLTATDAVAVRVADGGNLPPIVDASALPVFGPAPLSTAFLATFGDADGEVVSVNWDFGDGGTAAGASASYTYAAPGTYLAQVTVTDDQGLASTATVEVDVADASGIYPPQILSLPRTSAEVGQAYVYDDDGVPAARGDRPLTWSLGKNVGGETVGAPSGATVDPTTGRITWTPKAGQIGRMPVSLIAQNGAAAVVQDFEVEVGGVAPAPASTAADDGCGCASTQRADGRPLALGSIALIALVAVRRRRSAA